MNEYDALMKGDKVAHNEYDELLQQQTKANDTQARAAARKDLPPDTAAKIVDLADQTKLPRDVVERNLKAVDVDPRLNEYDQFLAHPVLRKYMADPYMQAAVKDDSTFGITDKLLNSLTRSVLNFQAGNAGTVTRANDRFVKELDDLDQMLGAGTAPELIPDAKDTTGYRWMTPEQRADTRRRLEEARSTGIQNIETYLKIAAAVPAIDPVVARAVQAESASEFWEFFSQKPIEFILTIGAESAVQSLAIAAGTALSGGNPLVALGIAGAGSYGMEYGNSILQGLRNEGVNLSDRAAIEKAVQDKNMMKRVAKYAHSRAAPVALFDAVAAGRAAGVRNFRGVARNILEQGALGAAGEATAQVAEGKKELAFGEIAAEFFGEMVTAPIEVSGVTAAAYRQYMQAQEQKTFFEALGTHAENSKLRERLPEKFREMVEEMTKDGPIENVYIDPRAFTQYFQSQNIDPRKAARDILGSEAPLDQALSSGQDLQIPTGVYAAKVAGTKHNAALTQDLKFGPDAISAREAESLLEEARQRAKQEAEKAKTEEGKQTEETVQTIVSKQLQAAGYEASTADMLAKQMEAFFNAQAERTGRKGAMELFKEYALRILGRNDQTRMGPEIVSLDQSAYHGSPHVFDQFSTKHIGKGEGAQVHGWGLYFAKQKHTAKVRYRDRLAPLEFEDDQGFELRQALEEDFNWGRALRDAKTANERIELGNDKVARLRDRAQRHSRRASELAKLGDPSAVVVQQEVQQLEEVANRIAAIIQRTGDLKVKRGGRLYEVDVKAEGNELLDLDASLESQRANMQHVIDLPVVREALADFAPSKTELTGRDLYRSLVRAAEVGDSRIWDVIGAPPRSRSMPGKPDEISSEEAASKFLLEFEVKGLKYDGKLDGPAMVIFDENLVEITSFEQDNARGRFIKYGDFEYDIQMLETADLSTFLHESGHFYLEILKNLAKDSPEVKADLDVLLKWMGIESVDQIEVQHHEQFARGLEAYFMEGKAPNVELRSVFARFRAWLMALYARMSALNVKLNDDVRQVMDRMFATEQEIAAASRENQLVPVFTTAEAAGMRPEEFERYLATIQRANQKATEELQTELMQAWSREQQTWWREQRRIVREEVLAARVQEPDVVAYYALRYGTSPDGTDLPSPIKLDRDSLVTMYGKDHAFIPTLRGLNMYRKDGGVHPDVAAPLFGFKSGDELVRAVINARGFQVEVDTKTDAVMKERYGDIMVDGTMADKARDAVMNDERAKILHAELKALTRLRNQVTPFVQEERNRQRAETSHGLAAIRGTPPLEVFQRLAKMRVGAMQVRSIKPNTFLVAARKAGIEAVEAATKNDFITAADAKQRELFNMEMYRVARNAVDETQKIVEYARSFSKTSVRQRLGHAGQDYVDQIDALVDRFDFRPTPVRDIDRRSRLADWIAQKERQGITVDLPDEIVNEAFKQHYKTLTFDQLQGVHDSLRHIDHLAKLKNKLIKSKDKRDLKVILDIIESTIRENAKKIDKNKTGVRLPQGEVGRFIDMFFASHRKMASYVRQMDGFEDGGALWTYLMQPLNDASAQEATMIHEAGLKLQELFKPYMTMKEEYKSAVTTLSLGLIEKGMYARQHVPSIGEPLSKMERLMVALNLGNDDNRTKLKAGYGWNDQQIQDIIAPLTKEDWDFVQGMWDFIDSYWPQIEAKEKRVNGIAPEKVEATPLQTPHGEYRGGYFPLKYEDRLAPKAYGDRAKEAAEQMIRGAYTQATTRRGHTKERVEGVKMPPRLDFGVIFEHTYQVVHDLSFHEYLIDANKILGSRQIQQAIIEAYGDQVYDQLRATLEDVAAGEVPAITAFEKSVNWLRQGTSIAAMGWNLTTALLQGLGLSQAIVRVGPEWVFKAFSRIFKDAGHLENSARWVHEKSEVMRNRHVTMAREINEIRNSIRGQTTVGVIGNSYFWLIAKGQQLVDIPTWIAMYEKAMHHGQTEERAIAMADQVVLDSQGGGQVKDLAQIQRGGPLMRLWTNFYSYFNVTYNLTAESFARTKIKDPLSVGRLAVDLLMLYSVPAVMGFFIKEGLRGDEPPEDLTKRLLREQASYVFGTMVGFREFSSVLNGFYGYEGPTGTRFYSETVKLIQQAEQGEVDEALLKSLNNAAGVLLHYPSGQVQRTVEGYAAWSEGVAGPQAVLLGKPQEAR